MESAFAWIGALIEWLGLWIPRLTIVDTTRGWVKFVRGRIVRSGGPGLVWHWPLITKLTVFPVVRDSLNCKPQTITMASGETALVEAVVIYEILDIEKLVAHTADPFSTIEDLVMGAILYVLEGVDSWADIQRLSKREPRARNSELNYRFKTEVQRELVPYGVNVFDVFLQNKAKARVIKLVNSAD